MFAHALANVQQDRPALRAVPDSDYTTQSVGGVFVTVDGDTLFTADNERILTAGADAFTFVEYSPDASTKGVSWGALDGALFYEIGYSSLRKNAPTKVIDAFPGTTLELQGTNVPWQPHTYPVSPLDYPQVRVVDAVVTTVTGADETGTPYSDKRITSITLEWAPPDLGGSIYTIPGYRQGTPFNEYLSSVPFDVVSAATANDTLATIALDRAHVYFAQQIITVTSEMFARINGAEVVKSFPMQCVVEGLVGERGLTVSPDFTFTGYETADYFAHGYLSATDDTAKAYINESAYSGSTLTVEVAAPSDLWGAGANVWLHAGPWVFAGTVSAVNALTASAQQVALTDVHFARFSDNLKAPAHHFDPNDTVESPSFGLTTAKPALNSSSIESHTDTYSVNLRQSSKQALTVFYRLSQGQTGANRLIEFNVPDSEGTHLLNISNRPFGRYYVRAYYGNLVRSKWVPAWDFSPA